MTVNASQEIQFEELVMAQARFVFRVAYAVLRNRGDAEDVVQETFLKLHRSGAWTAMRNERAFLARVAWRIAVDRRPRTRECTTEVEAVSQAADPEEELSSAEWTEAAHRMLDALPRELRQVLVLSGVEEMNSREIATVMGVAEGTVRTRLMRARQMMKEKLASLEGGRCEKR